MRIKDLGVRTMVNSLVALPGRIRIALDRCWDNGAIAWEERVPFDQWSHDSKVLTLALAVLVVGLIASFSLNLVPSLQAQFILLTLAIVGYVAGFCETKTAKRWGAVFFAINLAIWAASTLQIIVSLRA